MKRLRAAFALLACVICAPVVLTWTTSNCKRVYRNVSDLNSRVQGKCVVLVGASSGIGLQMAKQLAETHGALVIATGRSKEATARALALEAVRPSAIAGTFALDLSKDASVDAFVRDLAPVLASTCGDKAVPVVFLQAGMMYPATGPTDHQGERGLDNVFRANFMGFNRLAAQLFDGRFASALNGTRVVVTSSINHYGGKTASVLNPAAAQHDMTAAERLSWYAHSKAACQALVRHLRGKGIWTVSMTPGAVITGFVTTITSAAVSPTGWFSLVASPIMFLSSEGAHWTLLAALWDAPMLGGFLIPYYLPPWALVDPSDGSTLLQGIAVMFEVLQRITARPGYMWECREAPFVAALERAMKPLYFEW